MKSKDLSTRPILISTYYVSLRPGWNHNENLISLPNYNCITVSRPQKIRGGLAFFINEDLKFIHRTDSIVNITNIEIDVVEVIKWDKNQFLLIYIGVQTHILIF